MNVQIMNKLGSSLLQVTDVSRVKFHEGKDGWNEVFFEHDGTILGFPYRSEDTRVAYDFVTDSFQFYIDVQKDSLTLETEQHIPVDFLKKLDEEFIDLLEKEEVGPDDSTIQASEERDLRNG